jgi:Cdc6-like AAA superfamily ATPase
MNYAFPEGVWEPAAFDRIAKKTSELKDIRTGLFLMRESALIAESQSKKKVMLQDVEKAISKLDNFSIKKSTDLDDDSKFILELVKDNSGKKIGELFKVYESKGGKHSYKTFQRKIEELDENDFISTKKQTGTGGNTTIVEKKLTDF